MRSHFLTVAGAAQALSEGRTCFPFHLQIVTTCRHRWRYGRIIGFLFFLSRPTCSASLVSAIFFATRMRQDFHNHSELLDLKTYFKETAPMNDDFGSLEGKVERIIAMSASLRAENQRLRSRMVELEGENKAMTERMTEARTRIEALMERLPIE